MTTSAGLPSYGLAACLPCNNPYILTPTQRNCPLCGRPSELTIPFGGQEFVTTAEPPPEPEAVVPPPSWGDIDVICPCCNATLVIKADAEGIYLQVVPEAQEPSAEEESGGTPPQAEPAEPGPSEEPVAEAEAPEPAPAAEPVHIHSYQWQDPCNTWVCIECVYHVNHLRCECGWEPPAGPP